MGEYSRGDYRTTVLRGIPYRTYVRMTRVHDNRFLRMTYYDGTLEIASVRLLPHERARIEMDMVIRAVACELDIEYQGVGSTTFHRAGDGALKGWGKEPDQGYFFGKSQGRLNDEKLDLDKGGSPPDLWIEVDGRPAKRGQLPVYAALRVPELWRYRKGRKILRFLRLTDKGCYMEVDRSVVLPMLTPALVLEALGMEEGVCDSTWDRRLREWLRESFNFRPSL